MSKINSAMLEETHNWSPDRQKRWSKTRTRGVIRYVMKMVGIVFGLCIIIVSIYVAVTWNTDENFPWAAMLGIPFLGVLSALVVGFATWSASEDSFKRMQDRQL